MIYLDHAAATPMSDKVLASMRSYFAEDFFNPSAAYLPAKKVAADYEAAKATIAHAIGGKSHDLVITAGATEANNLALSSILYGGFRKSVTRGLSEVTTENEGANPATAGMSDPSRANAFLNPPILYLATEHDSVRRVAEHCGGEPIRVDRYGRIDLADLQAKITDSTELISVALVNGELGTIQPLSEIAAIIREVRLDRLRRGVRTKLLLHSDASQALTLLDVSVARLGVDLLTLNAAKIYGPKGVGALYVSHEVRLAPQIYGGGQEQGLRSGTENVPGVIGFATAVKEAKAHLNGNRKKYAHFREILLRNLRGCEIINRKHSLDNFVNICYNGIDGERLVFLLEEREIYVATGAACAASKGEKSHVLKALGLTDSEIAGSLRLTLGETNSEEQIIAAAKIINEVVTKEYERIQNG
ncbi:cysteine desulfurase [Candidatus Saccharibacteria bacterium]|nr:cysteine desulfurase [Candidatus Saccharibacteria bacterium]